MDKRKSLSAKEKYDKKKEFFKSKDNSKFDLLKIWPTLFNSGITLFVPQTFPNVFFANGSTTMTNTSGGGIPPNIFQGASSPSFPVTVPYIITFANLTQNQTINAGFGMTNFNSSAVFQTRSLTGFAGPTWGDTFCIAGLTSGCRYSVTNNNSIISNDLSFSPSISFMNNTNQLTIQEYVAGQIYAVITDSAGTLLTPWIQIPNPWLSLSETRCVVFVVNYGSSGTNLSGQIVATPLALIAHGQPT